jgi:Domain of unknown function (DUF4407)
MNPLRAIERFFQFLSKTDPDAMNSPCCTLVARMTQTSLGVMVLLTGVLAFFSGSYAIYTAFGGHSWGQFIAVPLGILYSTMIIVFDREIVGAQVKKAVWIRLPLAIAIGFIVAVPLELRLLQDSIDKHLIVLSKQENREPQDRLKAKLDAFDKRKQELQKEVQHYRDEVNRWNDNMEAETVGRQRAGRTGISGQGPAYREAERNRDANQQMLAKAEAELQKHEAQEGQAQQQFQQEFDNAQIAQAHDFLARYEALESLKSTSPGAFSISWGLRIFFILIEVFPALLKLFLPYSEYNAIVEARRRSQVQLVHAVSNKRLDDLARVPPTYPQASLLDLLNGQP